MPNLVLELKPGEQMIVNGAGLRFRTRARIELTSRARFLFGKQIMDADDATTPARRLYHALQTAYVGTEDQRAPALASVASLLAVLREDAGPEHRSRLDRIETACRDAEGYAALRLARDMVREEDRPHPSVR